MKKIWSIKEQRKIDIDELCDEIWRLDELIEDLENLVNKKTDNYDLEPFKEKTIRLRDELECKQDLIIQEESKTNEMFSDLYSKRKKAIYQLDLKAEWLVK